MSNLWRYKARRVLLSSKKEAILERDGYVCLYCLGNATEVDYFVPYSYGRSHYDGILVSCCEECNKIAGSRIFASLGEKTHFIISRRNGRKWGTRLKRKAEYGCIDCGFSFRPCVNGATNFLCCDCVDD